MFFLHNNFIGTCYRSLAFGKASAHSKFKNYCQQTLRRGLLTSLSSLSKTHNTRLPHDAWCRSNIIVPLLFTILIEISVISFRGKGIIKRLRVPCDVGSLSCVFIQEPVRLELFAQEFILTIHILKQKSRVINGFFVISEGQYE